MINDYYEVTTPAATEPVTLIEAKAWCKKTTTDEDALITALIRAATVKAELFTNRVFVERTFTGFFSGLDCSNNDGVYIELRRAPLTSVTSIKVMVDDVQDTVSTDVYDVQEESSFSRIIFSDTSNLDPDLIPYPYEVIFIAGYGAAAAVPDPIKTAIMEIVCNWHQNRGDCGEGDEIPGIAKGILSEYRILNTFG